MKEKDNYTEEAIRIAGFCKALGHPARITIMQLLLSKDSCICGDIVKEIPLAQSTVSQHLKELKNAGLIQGSITPPKIKYCVNQENWKEAQKMLNRLLK